jgi:pimeloyl-ACP methyl ester carboxylesterase
VPGREVIVGGLAGTWLAPHLAPVVTVLIVAGSGPTDRDGNNAHGLATDTYRHLAESLLENVVASLRYDKRGVAGSRALVTSEAALRADDFAGDVSVLLAWLRKKMGVGNIVVFGHSEGGLFALMAEAHADALVLACMPGRPLCEVLRGQLSPPRLSADLAAEAVHALGRLEAGEEGFAVDPRLAAVLRPSVQPYLRSLLAFDPAAALAATVRPALLISGGADVQVGAGDHVRLAAARPDAQTLVLPNMTHTLKAAPKRRDDGFETYIDPRMPLASGLVEATTAFVLGLAGAGGP